MQIHQTSDIFLKTANWISTRSAEKSPIKLKFHAGGQWIQSKTGKYMPCYNPSTGAVIAYAPQCSADEVEQTIQAAVKGISGMVRHSGQQAGPGALQSEEPCWTSISKN